MLYKCPYLTCANWCTPSYSFYLVIRLYSCFIFTRNVRDDSTSYNVPSLSRGWLVNHNFIFSIVLFSGEICFKDVLPDRKITLMIYNKHFSYKYVCYSIVLQNIPSPFRHVMWRRVADLPHKWIQSRLCGDFPRINVVNTFMRREHVYAAKRNVSDSYWYIIN